MAERIETPVITVPAGTPVGAPQTTPLSFLPGVVTAIEVDIPPGPSGLMGFVILHSGVQVLPRQDGQWIILDDAHKQWPLNDFPTGDKWALRAYNIDIYNHTIYLTFLIDEIPDRVHNTPASLILEQPNQLAPVPEG